MCIIHDLGEVFTGDIPTFDKTAANEQTEFSKFDGETIYLVKARQWIGMIFGSECGNFFFLFLKDRINVFMY